MKYIVSLDMVILLQIFSAMHSLTSPKSQCITGLIFRLQPLVDCFNQTGQYLQSSKVIYVFPCRELTEGNRGFSVVHQIFVKPELRLNPSPVDIIFF